MCAYAAYARPVEERVSSLGDHEQSAPQTRTRSAQTPGGVGRRSSLSDDCEQRTQQNRRLSARSWATLLRRTFAIDVLQCPCGGRRRLVALIEKREAIVAILNHLGLPTEVPTFAAAQPPPLLYSLEEGNEPRRVVLDPEFQHG